MNNNYNASTSTNSLNAIGITQQADGTYAVNTTLLQQAYTTDPTGVQSILSMAAFAFSNMTSTYTGTNGLIPTQLVALQSQVAAGNTSGQSSSTAQADPNFGAYTSSANLAALLGSGSSTGGIFA